MLILQQPVNDEMVEKQDVTSSPYINKPSPYIIKLVKL